MVVDDIAADSSGNANVRVEPRLREPVVAGPLVTSNRMLQNIPESWDEQRQLWEFPVGR